MFSPWSLLAVNRDDALQLLLAEQGRGAEGDAVSLRQAGCRQGLSHAARSPKGAQLQQLPLLFLFSFHLCFYLPPCGTWLSSGCVTGRQRSITALWCPGEGSSPFCSLEPWGEGGGKALSEQIVVLLLYKVLSIWLPLKSCCLVFQFRCATFKSAHLPSCLRLVVVRVPNYSSSALPPVLTISSKVQQPMGSGDCWTGMLAGGSA